MPVSKNCVRRFSRRADRKQEEEAVDPALLVKLPNGKLLEARYRKRQICFCASGSRLPRKRAGDERRFDDKLVDAVRDLQQANGLRADGNLDNRTRAALNSEGQPKRADPRRDIDRLDRQHGTLALAARRISARST